MTHLQSASFNRMAVGFSLNEAEKYSVRNDVLLAQSKEWSNDTLRKFLDGCDFETISFFYLTSTSENQQSFVNSYVSEQFMNNKISIKKRTTSSPLQMSPIVSSIEVYPNDPSMARLRSAITNIIIFGEDPESFEFVAHRLTQTPNKVTFRDSLHQNIPTGPYNHQEIQEARGLANRLNETLKGVKIVDFEMEKFKGPLIDELLAKCKMIEHLVIHSKPTKRDQSGSYVNKWCYMEYSHLTSIHWNDGVVSKRQEFAKFLELNPNVKHLKFTKNILLAIDFIDDVDLQGGIFEITVNSSDNIPTICDRLNDLHMKSRFKKLIMIFNDQPILNDHVNLISMLPGLERISMKGSFIPSIGRLKKLKQLTIDSLNGTIDVQPLQMLERVYVKSASYDELKPFIQLPNLDTIAIKELQEESISGFLNMVHRRENVLGAKELAIYLGEHPYMDFKRYKIDTTIQIRRISSLDF